MRIFAITAVAMLCVSGFANISDDLYQQCYNHALEKVREGDLESAKASFEQALSFKPNDPNAQKGLVMVEERLNPEAAPKTAPKPVEESAVVNGAEKKNDFALRFAIGTAPGIEKESAVGTSYPVMEDDGIHIEALAIQRFWSKSQPNIGGIFGGGLYLSNFGGTDIVGDEYDATVVGLIGQGGVVFQLGKYIVIEGVPYLGFGGGTVELGDSDGDFSHFMYGVKGNIFILLGKNVELGLEAGYRGFTGEYTLDTGSYEIDVELTGSGPTFGGVLAIKF